jgi:hypothetical protein
MCLPLAAASLMTAGLQIGGAVMGYMGAVQQANAQVKYQERLAEQRKEQILRNRELAGDSLRTQMAQQNIRRSQEEEAASREKFNVSREAQRRMSTTGVAAGESGAAGVSLAQLYTDFERSKSEYTSMIDRKIAQQGVQYQYDQDSMIAQYEGRLDSIQPYIPTPVNMPSPFAYAAKGASAAMPHYDDYLRYSKSGHYATNTD